MITSTQCLKRYGAPELEKAMVLYDVPTRLEVGAIPKKIYCNRDLVAPLEMALTNVVNRGLADKIRTWDGCFSIRKKRGGKSASLHSWGLAVDINAAWNGYGKKPTMDSSLVKCFTDAGFDWGGEWSVKDGMHFQLSMF
jgi:hypothetical protein